MKRATSDGRGSRCFSLGGEMRAISWLRLCLVAALELGPISNHARADNLVCGGSFGRVGGPLFTPPSGKVNPGQTATTCPVVLKSKPVATTECFVAIVFQPDKPPENYRCPLGKSCSGVGTFQSITRVPGPSNTTDRICATYIDQSGYVQTFGIHITIGE